MDFTKYPGLAKVDYYEAIMEEGDCLYIPYQWYDGFSSFYASPPSVFSHLQSQLFFDSMSLVNSLATLVPQSHVKSYILSDIAVFSV